MRSEDDLLTSHEVAKMLRITVEGVKKMVQRGTLRSIPKGNSAMSPRLFRQEDVAALVEARESNLDITSVAAMARQAYVASRNLEKLVANLLEVMGARLEPLEVTKEAVLALYAKVEHALEEGSCHLRKRFWIGLGSSMR